MDKIYHILNGDALKEQFPVDIFGEKIVARLCLVDGPVDAETDDELFRIRASFISENFSEFSEEDYKNLAVEEIRKIEDIPENAILNLWFEDDLFCQVNFWFILYFISKNNKKIELNLVRPKKHSEYAFGGMNNQELVNAYENKVSINSDDLTILKQFWKLYQKNEIDNLFNLSKKLNDKYPFLMPAISAHKDRLSGSSRPKVAIQEIIKELNTDKFEPVFRAFCQQEPIYGFGDFQVKRLFDEVINEKPDDNN